MSADLERLEARLAELRSERGATGSMMTKEALGQAVGEWVAAARAQAAGASRLVVNGQAHGEHLDWVLREDLLGDEGLAGRVVGRLEAQGFGSTSERAKKQRLAKLDSAIAAAEQELLAARKREALEQVEREFGGVAA